MPRRPSSRRAFLASAAGTLAAPMYVSARRPNERLNVAVIGCGGRGVANLAGVATENVVALCDVNRAAIGAAAGRFPRAAHYADFRRLFDEKARDFDAVVVSTCEHTHAHATLRALRSGKHVYCEKPLTHNVWEARLIRTEAAKTKLATQMGTQIHAQDNYRRVVELVKAGAIGAVSEVHVWVGRAWGLQSAEDAKKNGDIVHVTDRPTEDVRPPAELDWDLWIGPAPMRPFSPVYVPGPKWYRWWAFGNGTMSDLGSHWNDLPFWALDLKAPTSVEASGPLPPHPEIAPASMQAKYYFPPRRLEATPVSPGRPAAPVVRPSLVMTWYQGANKPPHWTQNKIPRWDSGVLFVGDRGMLLSDYSRHLLLPENQFADYTRPPQSIPKSLGHYQEWIHACKTGAPTTCNFEYAGWLTEANHLGNVAYRVGKRLDWDAEAMKATNCPEADPLIRREYRRGWELA